MLEKLKKQEQGDNDLYKNVTLLCIQSVIINFRQIPSATIQGGKMM